MTISASSPDVHGLWYVHLRGRGGATFDKHKEKQCQS